MTDQALAQRLSVRDRRDGGRTRPGKPLPLPWRDRSGQFSAFKAAVFALLLLPGLVLVARYLGNDLGPRPLTELIRQSGLWTIRLLFVSLALTPLRQILDWPRLALVRRLIGVTVFGYAACHLLAYAADQQFNLARVASEIVLRIYLTIGFVAVLGLAALAATSTDAMARRLGGRAWRRLHRTIYAIGLLAAVHFYMQSRLDITEPVVMAGLYVWLMAYRLLARRSAVWLTALAVGAGGAAAAIEAALYGLVNGIDPRLVLEANLSWNLALATGPRPAWTVTAIALAATALALCRSRPRLARAARQRPA